MVALKGAILAADENPYRGDDAHLADSDSIIVDIDLDRGCWKKVIGRDSNCDIVLDREDVSVRHALLLKENERFYIEDLSSTAGTTVHKVRLMLGLRMLVTTRSEIRIGKTLLRLRDPVGKEKLERQERRVVAQLDLGRENWSNTVGRKGQSGSDCDIVIDGPHLDRMSERHARLIKDGNAIYIEDLRSKNGTYINGNRLDSGNRYLLKSGDRLILGGGVFYLRANGELVMFVNNDPLPIDREGNLDGEGRPLRR
jgi:pSer/pThr/pTyr-binding forkhead associated (FHA) protein